MSTAHLMLHPTAETASFQAPRPYMRAHTFSAIRFSITMQMLGQRASGVPEEDKADQIRDIRLDSVVSLMPGTTEIAILV